MVDRKKIVAQRQNRGRLRDMPLTNFAILVIVFVQVVGEGLRIYPLQLLKPVPIILMIAYIHYKNRQRQHLVPTLIEIGIAICLIGDILLMFNDIESFVLGTAVFFVGHLFYIAAFEIGSKVRKLNRRMCWARRAAYVAITALLINNVYTLWDKFPNKLVYTGYGVVLAVQMCASLKRYQTTSNSSFYFTLIGVVLFAVSDNMLGFLKFNGVKTDLGRSIIMITYYSAQYFIMHGALHQSTLKHQIDQIQQQIKHSHSH